MSNILLKKFKRYLKYRYQVKKLMKQEVIIGDNVNFKYAKFEGKNTVENGVNIKKSILGLGTYIGTDSSLANTKIGRYSSIGMRVYSIVGNHPIENVSTHPFSYSKIKEEVGLSFSNSIKKPPIQYTKNGYLIEIGNDVWIGDNVTILNSVVIGDGAVIASGAVVINDVEPYSVVGGVPAKKLKMRFEENEIEFLLKFKWWEKGYKWLKDNVQDFNDIKKFIKNNSEK